MSSSSSSLSSPYTPSALSSTPTAPSPFAPQSMPPSTGDSWAVFSSLPSYTPFHPRPRAPQPLPSAPPPPSVFSSPSTGTFPSTLPFLCSLMPSNSSVLSSSYMPSAFSSTSVAPSHVAPQSIPPSIGDWLALLSSLQSCTPLPIRPDARAPQSLLPAPPPPQRVELEPDAVIARVIPSASTVPGGARASRNDALKRRFTAIEQIGSGSNGRVFKAVYIPSASPVAIKCNKKADPAHYRGLCAEGRILKQLPDRLHFPRYLGEFDWSENRRALVQTLLPESNLYEAYLHPSSEERLEWRQVVHITYQSVRALKDLADAGIGHYDIKPGNMSFCAETGVNTVMDFGLARKSKEPKVRLIGSRYYRAPEVPLKVPFDRRFDMWSLGCTLFEMATEKVLFKCDGLDTDPTTDIRHIETITSLRGAPPEDLRRMSPTASKFFHVSPTGRSCMLKRGESLIRMPSDVLLEYVEREIRKCWRRSLERDHEIRLLANLINQMVQWKQEDRISIEGALRFPLFDYYLPLEIRRTPEWKIGTENLLYIFKASSVTKLEEEDNTHVLHLDLAQHPAESRCMLPRAQDDLYIVRSYQEGGKELVNEAVEIRPGACLLFNKDGMHVIPAKI